MRPKLQDYFNASCYGGLPRVLGRAFRSGNLLSDQVRHPLSHDIVTEGLAGNNSLAEFDDCLRAIE